MQRSERILGAQENPLRSLFEVNEEAVVAIWRKGTRKMHEQRVADCGGNFVPNKKASPQASERRIYEGGSLKSKNAENGGIFVPKEGASPQASERRICEGGSLKSKNA